MCQNIIMAKLVQMFGASAGDHVRGNHVQYLGGKAACFMHASKAFGTMSDHCIASHFYPYGIPLWVVVFVVRTGVNVIFH